MLSAEEKKFVAYWKEQRLHKKAFLKKLSIGLPIGVLVALLVVLNMFSGWYGKAESVVRGNTSVIFVVLAAAVGIVIFFVIFSNRHQWDINELRYRELMAREGLGEDGAATLPEDRS